MQTSSPNPAYMTILVIACQRFVNELTPGTGRLIQDLSQYRVSHLSLSVKVTMIIKLFRHNPSRQQLSNERNICEIT